MARLSVLTQSRMNSHVYRHMVAARAATTPYRIASCTTRPMQGCPSTRASAAVTSDKCSARCVPHGTRDRLRQERLVGAPTPWRRNPNPRGPATIAHAARTLR